MVIYSRTPTRPTRMLAGAASKICIKMFNAIGILRMVLFSSLLFSFFCSSCILHLAADAVSCLRLIWNSSRSRLYWHGRAVVVGSKTRQHRISPAKEYHDPRAFLSRLVGLWLWTRVYFNLILHHSAAAAAVIVVIAVTVVVFIADKMANLKRCTNIKVKIKINENKHKTNSFELF